MDYLLEASQALSNKHPIQDALRHALRHKTGECCGLFLHSENRTWIDYNKLNNPSINCENYFFIDNNSFSKLYKQNLVFALFHSHINCDHNLSNLDIEMSESLGIPSVVYSLISKEFNLYYPLSYIPPPLKYRSFIPVFQDCITFVKDYFYFNFNIQLNKKIKNWFKPRNSFNESLLNIVENNFDTTDKDIAKLEKGDVLVFPPSTFETMHVALYDNDQYIYHHPAFSYPTREFITPETLDKVYKVYRYKDL